MWRNFTQAYATEPRPNPKNKMEPTGPFAAAQAFDAESLRIAREYKGLLKKDLAARVNISPSAITQFEAGSIRPHPETVSRIALVLGLPVDFFSGPRSWVRVDSDQCHFRSLRSASQRDRRRVLAAAAILRHIVDYLETRVNLPIETLSPFQSDAGTDEEIEGLAAGLRRGWSLGLGPIPKLITLFESRGVLAFRLFSGCDRVDAFSFWSRERPFIFLNIDKDSASRSRFDAAHELGHLLMHADCSPGDKLQEIQAHKFASAFLMPKETIERELPRRVIWPHFLELKRRWGVSVAALLRRAVDLGVISGESFRRANRQLSAKGWKTEEPSEPAPEVPELIRDSVLTIVKRDSGLRALSSKLRIPAHILDELTLLDHVSLQPNLPLENVARFAAPNDTR